MMSNCQESHFKIRGCGSLKLALEGILSSVYPVTIESPNSLNILRRVEVLVEIRTRVAPVDGPVARYGHSRPLAHSAAQFTDVRIKMLNP